MSSRATRNICIFCQHAASSSRSRARLTTTLRQLSTVQSSDNGPPPESSGPPLPELERTLQHQSNLFSPVDMLREALSPQKKGKDNHQKNQKASNAPGLLQRPRDPPLITPVEAVEYAVNNPSPRQLKEWPTLTQAQFRDAISRKAMRRVMRTQLEVCQTPRDILRVVAVAMQRPETAMQISILYHSLSKALYNARSTAPDKTILATLNAIIARFRLGKIPVANELIVLGLKFAARTRSLPAMKRYLKETKGRGAMSKHVFRSVIAKCSIGSRGLGEIRNGKWKKKELLQVLTGFPDTPPEEACHLGMFLRRDEWSYIHGWVTILAKCGAKELVWEEWELWRQNPERITPRWLTKAEIEQAEKDNYFNKYMRSREDRQGEDDVESSSASNIPSQDLSALPASDAPYPRHFQPRSTRTRGDLLFVEQLVHAGDAKGAWQVLKETGLPWGELGRWVRSKLLEHVEYATIWNDELREAMKQKYLEDLDAIEKALGVRWVTDGDEGYHVLSEDPEEVLERLSEPPSDPRHGFPLEGDEDDT